MREDMCGADLSPALASRRCGGYNRGWQTFILQLLCDKLASTSQRVVLYCKADNVHTPMDLLAIPLLQQTHQYRGFPWGRRCSPCPDTSLVATPQGKTLQHPGVKAGDAVMLCLVRSLFPYSRTVLPQRSCVLLWRSMARNKRSSCLVAICFKTLSLQAPG